MNIGDKWNGWTIESLIGQGTFGKVYRIVREDFSHTYESALKVISIPQNEAEILTFRNEGMSDESITTYYRGMVEEIVSEFVIMSELKGNSNIVSYEDHYYEKKKDAFGWDIYIRMEMLTPLFQYMKDHPFTIRDSIKLGIDICKALEVCQRFNIIHRDVKPENIFVSKLGDFKIGDFGIAKRLENATASMSRKGTYSYMAPEVYKGQTYNSTVDIYSLGIVLYRILNRNRLPFLPPYPQEIKYTDRETANVRRLSGDPMPAPMYADGRLGEIVLKACAYDPKDRYESPRAMREALESIAYSEAEGKLIHPEGDYIGHETSVTKPWTEYDKDYLIEPGSDGSKGKSKHLTAPSFSETEEKDDDQTMPLFPEIEHGNEDLTTPLFFEEESGSAFPNTYDAQSTVVSPEALILEKYSEQYSNKIPAKGTSQGTKSGQFSTSGSASGYTSPVIKEEKTGPEQVYLDLDEYETVAATADEPKPEPVPEYNAGTVTGTAPAAEPAQEVRKIDPKEVRNAGLKKILAVVAAVCVLIGGFGIYKYLNHAVPDVVGMDSVKAEKAISDAGLKYKETKEFSDSVERGIIISQTNQGQTVKRQTEIGLTVSAGVPVPAPDMTGLTEEEAKKEAEKAGLSVAVAGEELSDNIKKGGVTGQDPAPGSDCEAESEIQIIISKGIVQVEVPNVIGETSEKAKAAIENAGLKCEITSEYSSEPAGNIIAQSVEAGKSADKNSTVTITESNGPAPKASGGGGGSSKKKSKSKKKKSKKEAEWS